jgi:uncharacterized membrane protein
MAAILTSLRNTVLAGFVLAVVVFVIMALVQSTGYSFSLNKAFWSFVVRWLHVLSGIMWIGMLYYFNFVQTPSMPKIPDEQKPAITKVVAPEALFWFRWAAMSTIIFGIVLALLGGFSNQNYLLDAILLGITSKQPAHTMIGIGMWLGTIMWFNVWFVIWPAQKKVLGIVEATPDEKKAAGRTGLLFSRTNTMLSVPMLYCMIAAKVTY